MFNKFILFSTENWNLVHLKRCFSAIFYQNFCKNLDCIKLGFSPLNFLKHTYCEFDSFSPFSKIIWRGSWIDSFDVQMFKPIIFVIKWTSTPTCPCLYGVEFAYVVIFIKPECGSFMVIIVKLIWVPIILFMTWSKVKIIQ